MFSKRCLLVFSSAFLMALLALSLAAPLLPTSPLSTVVSNAQEPFYPRTTVTEYPWTYKGGHCTDEGNYPWWFYTPGPGPLTDHILWRYNEQNFKGLGTYSYTGEKCILVFNGKVVIPKHAFDAASGEELWFNAEALTGPFSGVVGAGGVVGWIPADPQQYEGYTFMPNPPVYNVSTDITTGFILIGGTDSIQSVDVETGQPSIIPAVWPLNAPPGPMSALFSSVVTPHTTMWWDFPVTGAFGVYDTRYYYTSMDTGVLRCYDPMLLPGQTLWDTLTISLDTTIEYPILQQPGVFGGRIMAKGAGSYERPPEEMINGTVFPTDDYLEWFRCYWGRYAKGGGCTPIVATGDENIMYINCGASGMSQAYNTTSGQWAMGPIDPNTGSVKLAWPYPWYIEERINGTGFGRSIGEPELLNIDGGKIVACDFDWETLGGVLERDTAAWLMAYNMTDGKLLWRRINSYGCYNPGVDSEKNIVWIGGASTVHVFDATTGEKKWWWRNPAYAGETSETSMFLGYDGEKFYVTCWTGDTFAIDAETGETVWRTEHGCFNSCSGANYISEESNLIYVSTYRCRGWAKPETEPGAVIAMDRDTGEIVWRHDFFCSTGMAIADGRLYVSEANKGLVCFGAGPTKTSLTLSSEQLKAGDTVLLSGQLLDQSPPSSGNFNAPVADASVTLMYCPLGGLECNTIATVTTGYAGDYYYEWTVPSNMTGMYSVIASYAGDNPSYLESSTQANFRVGAAGLSEAEMSQVTAAVPDYSMMFYAVIAAIIITLALVVYIAFVRKK